MSYTKQDVKELRDALLDAKLANAKTHKSVMAIFDFDFETARTAEALQLLNEADDKIEEAVKLLARECDRIAERAAEEAGADR